MAQRTHRWSGNDIEATIIRSLHILLAFINPSVLHYTRKVICLPNVTPVSDLQFRHRTDCIVEHTDILDPPHPDGENCSKEATYKYT